MTKKLTSYQNLKRKNAVLSKQLNDLKKAVYEQDEMTLAQVKMEYGFNKDTEAAVWAGSRDSEGKGILNEISKGDEDDV